MFRHVLMPRCFAAVTAFQRAAVPASATRAFASGAAPRLSLNWNPPQREPIMQRLKLNMLRDNPGAIKQKRRKGRGIGSGRGKTCGRGHKGTKARQGGKVGVLFNGGPRSSKYWKKLPKRGFNNKKFQQLPQPINLNAIAMHISMKRLDPTKPIGLREMQLAGLFAARDVKHGIKLLAKGENLLKMHPSLQLVVNRASESAVKAVEKRGGTVTSVHMNRLALRTVLRPQKFVGKLMPRHARPPPKYQPYYTSWKKRGYLHPAVQMRSWFGRSEENKAMEARFLEILERNQASQDDNETNSGAAGEAEPVVMAAAARKAAGKLEKIGEKWD